MRSACLRVAALAALLACLPDLLLARVYYVNRGVKYHIGDDRFSSSQDPDFVGAYPVVGEEWIQAFKVTQDDRIKVSIGHIWGVDDCPYCKIMVQIDDGLLGRLFQENNHKPFDTPDPLAYPVKKGRTYFLKIVSYASFGSADDFVFSDVVVETDHAEVRFLQPGPIIKMPDDPMPKVYDPEPTQASACGELAPNRNWLLGWDKGGPAPTSLKPEKDFAESADLAVLESGQSLDFKFMAQAAALAGNRVDHAFEIMVGKDVKTRSGWVFQLHDGVDGLYHGNLKVAGRYTARSFSSQVGKTGINQARLEYCKDGSLHLLLNGKDVGQALEGLGGPQTVMVRSLGLPVTVQGEGARPAEAGAAAPAF